MSIVIKELYEMQDKQYRDFQTKLIPTINSNTIIGIRTPELRKYAKNLIKENNCLTFLKDLPHTYFDENQLHAFIISEIKDYDECLIYVNEFLPFINNWATCDQTSPKAFKNNHDKLLKQVKIWLKSSHTYTVRFAIKMLMQHYLDKDFKPEYLKLVSKVKSNDYYINMMIAWFFATALAKQYQNALPYLEEQKLSTWIHNKTIQKAIESYRINEEQKSYLRSLKV